MTTCDRPGSANAFIPNTSAQNPLTVLTQRGTSWNSARRASNIVATGPAFE